MKSLAILLPLAGTASAASAYSQYILAPSSRTVYPATLHRVNGSVSNAETLLASPNGNATFRGNSSITFDYAKNVGGIVSLTVASSHPPGTVLGVTFTESSMWINGQACDGTADAGLDSPLWIDVGADGPGTYTVDSEFERGAFRYLSLVSNSSEAVGVTAVAVNFTAAPTQELQDYSGYFHSDDELLNRVWYAGKFILFPVVNHTSETEILDLMLVEPGAYTCQICSIDPQHGNSLIWLGVITSDQVIELPETVPWWNNYTITGGKTALVDGAKRDRIVCKSSFWLPDHQLP